MCGEQMRMRTSAMQAPATTCWLVLLAFGSSEGFVSTALSSALGCSARVAVGNYGTHQCVREQRAGRRMRAELVSRADRAGRASGKQTAIIMLSDSEGDLSDPFASSKKRAQTINYAFIASCVPGIMPYQEAVDSFVSTTIDCLDAGVSLGALDLTMSQTQSTGNADIDRQLGFAQGRQFAAEEVALRRQWILFVYAAALAVGSHAPEFSSPGDLAALSYVRNIYNNFWKKGQRDIKSINLEMTLMTAESNLAAKTPTEKAMLSQALRFALTAFNQLSASG